MIIDNIWKVAIGRDVIIDLNKDHLCKLSKSMQNQFQLKNATYFFNRQRYNCFIEYADDVELKKLAKRTITSVRKYLSELYDESEPYELEIQGWSMVQSWGEFVMPHHHVGHHLSAVFYVDVPEIIDSPIKESGSIIFNHPAPLARSWIVRSNKNPEHNLYTVKVKTNDLLIFPSYLIHSVNPWFGSKERIAYAMNLFVKRDIDFEPMLSEKDL
jgi:uncharacterized protein (TIGR02466 family)